MNKKLGALALVGASAVVLAGCAGGSGSAPSEAATGDLTVWLVGADTPQTARDYLKETFEDENEGWTLTVEEKTWADVSDTYTAALSSNDSPDVVEVGNTQALGFADAGLFLDISDIQEDLGGDDLLVGPRGCRHLRRRAVRGAVLRRWTHRLLHARRSSATRCRRRSTSTSRRASTLKTDTVSGIYAPGKDWYNALPYVWAHGGEIAVQDGDEWDAQFSSDESLEGLEQLQDVYLNASVAPVDGNERLGNIDFCAGEVGFLSSPAWAAGNITGDWPWGDEAAGEEVSRGLPRHLRQGPRRVRAARPEGRRDRPDLRGRLERRRRDQERLARARRRPRSTIMLSEGYQKLLAEQGLTPGIKSAARVPARHPDRQGAGRGARELEVHPDQPELGRGRGRADHPRRARQDRAGRRRRGDRGRARHGHRGDPQQVVHLEGSGSRAWAPPACLGQTQDAASMPPAPRGDDMS